MNTSFDAGTGKVTNPYEGILSQKGDGTGKWEAIGGNDYKSFALPNATIPQFNYYGNVTKGKP